MVPDSRPLGQLPAANVTECRVLVVDDDPACVDEYAEIVDGLGYRCSKALDAPTALRMIAEDPRIGIVVTDVQMPAMDGISFLDELTARFALFRPIVSIVVTGFGSLDTAVKAMRFNAVDFLAKPVSRDDFAASLRRASQRWAQLVGQIRLTAMTRMGEAAAPAPAAGASAANAEQTPEELATRVRAILKSRQRRADFLDPELFADPAWDILLDLTSARLEGKPVPVSSACAAAAVPMSTALRHVRHLVESGLVKRWKDPQDKRRDLLELNDEAMKAMTGYFTAIGRRNSGDIIG